MNRSEQEGTARFNVIRFNVIRFNVIRIKRRTGCNNQRDRRWITQQIRQLAFIAMLLKGRGFFSTGVFLCLTKTSPTLKKKRRQKEEGGDCWTTDLTLQEDEIGYV